MCLSTLAIIWVWLWHGLTDLLVDYTDTAVVWGEHALLLATFELYYAPPTYPILWSIGY